uniref:Uncharacterized protein n=1 Tax=Sphaerodactylus townsendi TaxID=933632 RepID=A0ACB8F2S1_9SAUR
MWKAARNKKSLAIGAKLPNCRRTRCGVTAGVGRVKSIEFDRDCDYFAIAGVTKKIKVYEYGTVIQDAVDIHYPENEMTCNSKIRWGTEKIDRKKVFELGTSQHIYYAQMSVDSVG